MSAPNGFELDPADKGIECDVAECQLDAVFCVVRKDGDLWLCDEHLDAFERGDTP